MRAPISWLLVSSLASSASAQSTAAVVVGGYSGIEDTPYWPLLNQAELYGCPTAPGSIEIPSYPKGVYLQSGLYTQDSQGPKLGNVVVLLQA